MGLRGGHWATVPEAKENCWVFQLVQERKLGTGGWFWRKWLRIEWNRRAQKRLGKGG